VRTLEANWETGVLVTAEAAGGIGFPLEVELVIGQPVPQEGPSTETVAGEAAD